MPGLPSTTSEIESPTGCTKQLISVALQSVPAADIDAAGGDEAVFLRLEETPFPSSALVLGLDCGERARDARAHLGDAVFSALRVFLEQDFSADCLIGEGRNRYA